MATEHPPSDRANDFIVGFIYNAFGHERTRQHVQTLFQWISRLPKDLDPETQRALFIVARRAIAQAVQEARREHGALLRQVPQVLHFVEQKADHNLDELVDRLSANLSRHTDQHLPPSSVLLVDRAPTNTEEIGKLDLDRAFDTPIDTNIGGISPTRRSMKRSAHEASKLKTLKTRGNKDE